MNRQSMRDAFFDRLYQIAKADPSVLLISADMGAPSLDKFRADLKSQFINVGIAEQIMATLAAGLALSGKKVFTYAIMPFVTGRCLEPMRVTLSMMNLPVTVVGVGAGFSYDDSGPTHHSTDDLAFMRALPNITLLNASDSVMAAAFAGMACQIPGPSYVRLDREVLPHAYPPGHDFTPGLHVHKPGADLAIIATGNMLHKALETAAALQSQGVSAGVIDLYRIQPVPAAALLQALAGAKAILTLEEHYLTGGMSSAVIETLADAGLRVPTLRVGVPNKHYYAYGGRASIQSHCRIDPASVVSRVMDWLGRARKDAAACLCPRERT
ncbi:MAG TPA: transketolase C-terminal domain-containing protein [Candidatus Brocadiia bacterium]|nr:transketolase C-terminal domain-containing protein [Candidatus Brocadiia bacterium]